MTPGCIAPVGVPRRGRNPELDAFSEDDAITVTSLSAYILACGAQAEGRGRDEDYSSPPAACATNADSLLADVSG
jgi:hypothetical protein